MHDRAARSNTVDKASGTDGILSDVEQFCNDVVEACDALFPDRSHFHKISRIAHELQQRVRALALRPEVVMAVIPYGSREAQLVRSMLESLDQTHECYRLPIASVDVGMTANQRESTTWSPATVIDSRSEVVFLPTLEERRSAVCSCRDNQIPATYGAAAVVLVVPQSQLRDEVVWKSVSHGAAGNVYPVVVIEEMDEDDRWERDIRDRIDMWREILPADSPVILHPPRFLFDPRLLPDKAKQANGDCIRGILEAARMVPDAAAHRTASSRILRQQAMADMRDVLTSVEPRTEHQFRELRRMPEFLAHCISQELSGRVETLAGRIAHQLRVRMLEDTPLFCFPYRSVVGLLVLTAGAWDHLVTAPLGLVGAWIKTGWTSVRNVKDITDFSRRWYCTAQQRCLERLADEFQPVLRDIQVRVKKAFGGPSDPLLDPDGDQVDPFVIDGVDDAMRQSDSIVQAAIQQASPPRRTSTVLGLVGLATFAIMIAGPVLSVYRRYLAASWSASVEGIDGIWETVPLVNYRYIISFLTYSTAPVFVVAMAALAWVSRRNAVDRVVEQVHHEHREFEPRIRSLIRVRLNDARINAYLRLRSLISIPLSDDDTSVDRDDAKEVRIA